MDDNKYEGTPYFDAYEEGYSSGMEWRNNDAKTSLDNYKEMVKLNLERIASLELIAESHDKLVSEIKRDWAFVTGWMDVCNLEKENPRHPVVVFDYLLRGILEKK